MAAGPVAGSADGAGAPASPFSQATVHRQIGKDQGRADSGAPSARDMTVESVAAVLEEVRPYLQADGGDLEVVGVADGVVALRLEGACRCGVTWSRSRAACRCRRAGVPDACQTNLSAAAWFLSSRAHLMRHHTPTTPPPLLCSTCASSSATMKMGIERALAAAFGDQLKGVVQVRAFGTQRRAGNHGLGARHTQS